MKRTKFERSKMFERNTDEFYPEWASVLLWKLWEIYSFPLNGILLSTLTISLAVAKYTGHTHPFAFVSMEGCITLFFTYWIGYLLLSFAAEDIKGHLPWPYCWGIR